MKTPPDIIRLLAHDLRWQLVSELAHGDYRVNELVQRVGQQTNLVSYHLKKLRDGGLVTVRQGEADGRDTYYSLDLDHLRAIYTDAGGEIHAALLAAAVGELKLAGPHRVLFVCTRNSARSQMAEALLRHHGRGQVTVSSAGSHPTQVHPDAVATMDAMGIDIRDQRSSSFDDVAGDAFDTVITVCDHAREVCPTFPGEGRRLHWGFPDPSAIDDAAARRAAFADTAQRLDARVRHFLRELRVSTSSRGT